MWCAELRPGRHVATGILALLLVLLPVAPAPVSAQGGPCGDAETSLDDSGGSAAAEDCPDPAPEGTEETRQTGGGSSGPPAIPCEERVDDRDGWRIAYDPDWSGVSAEEEVRLLLNRPDADAGPHVIGVLRDCANNDRGAPFWTPAPAEGDGGDAWDQIQDAIDRAYAAVTPDPPAPELRPRGRVLNGLPAWLWVDRPWEEQSATDTTVGGLTVAVYAEPTELTWDTPEGTRSCAGPGVPWTEAAWDAYQAQPVDDRGHGNPACTFVFENASTDQDAGQYPTTVSVTWSFSFTVGGGPRAEMGDLELTTDLPVTVGEVRAVRTR